jgi:prepilin-type N-terminal cleavage/methylation domain-containing protein
MRIKGFTLSEILITLGIIGVVAALTLPAIIKHYQQQAVVGKVKKFYTEMNQVLQIAKSEHGDFSSWDKSNSETFYLNYIKPYIKNVDIKHKYLINVRNIFNNGVNFRFADGTQVILSARGSERNEYKYPVFIFYIRTNNINSINAMTSSFIKHATREQFYFYINEKGYLEPPEKNSSRSNLIKQCSKKMDYNNGYNYGNNGHETCSTLIYLDGWQISKDYPW